MSRTRLPARCGCISLYGNGLAASFYSASSASNRKTRINILKLPIEMEMTDLPLGLEAIVPANILEINELLAPKRKLKFVFITDRKDLAFMNMAADPRNVNKKLLSEEDIENSTRRPIQIIATACKKRGIEFYVASQKKRMASDEFADGLRKKTK